MPERQFAGQPFVGDGAERTDVGAVIDLERARSGMNVVANLTGSGRGGRLWLDRHCGIRVATLTRSEVSARADSRESVETSAAIWFNPAV